MTEKTQKEIDIAAVFDAFVYLDEQDTGYEGWRLCDIIKAISNQYLQEEKKQYLKVIQDAMERNPEISNYVLVSQSSRAPEDSKSNRVAVPNTLLWACTFRSPDNDYYVTYRGTGEGKWLDNGEGLYKEDTVMQQAAAYYFDAVVEEKNLDRNTNIIVTGHSKGGNSAQYVTLAAKNADLIDSCYSFNGQGFSEKAIEKFKNMLRDQYQVQIDKMYSINGNNDYVHDLGITVIPSERTFFVEVPETDIVGMHALQFMIIDGEIKLQLDPPIQQGPVGEFAKRLSKEMMQLSEDDLRDCALSVMSLLELLMNGEGDNIYYEGTGDVKFASFEEFCGFISVGIPLLLKVAVTTEEVRSLIGSIAMNMIGDIGESENKVKLIIAVAAVALICAPAVVALTYTGTIIWKGAVLVDTLFELFDKTVESSDEMGVTFVAKIMIKAALQLASNPQIVGAVLSVIVVIGFVIYLAQHWTEIKALIKVIGDFTGRLSIVFSAWAENLAELTVNLIKIAGEKVIAVCQDIKQEILDFINRLRQEAYSFCIRILQELSFYFGSIEKWIKCLFGGCSGLLRGSNQILIIIDRIEELQHRIKTLHMTYFEAEKKLGDAKTLVQKVYNDYDESYVRRCCRDIQNDLKNAQKYLNSVEQELAQKRRVLVMAVSDYYQSDQNAVRVIRTFG